MRTDIAYVNGLGERIEFGGSEESLHYMEHELRDWKWSWSTGTAGRVTGFARRGSKPIEIKLPVGIAAESGAEGIELRNRIEGIGERDIAAREPGKLYVGDWYMRCWIAGCSPTDYWMDDRFAELELTLLAEQRGWIRETLQQYVPETGTEPVAGVDFPLDFPFEFMRGRSSKSIYNGSISAQDLLLRVYGPASDPAVSIGGSVHRVNVEVPAGYRLEIDTMAKTVRLVAPDGSWSDAYGFREPGAEGSGTYIFERIAPGSSSLSWGNDFTFDLVRYEVRMACPWEEG